MARILGSKLCDVMGPQRVFLASGATGAAAASVLLPLGTNWTWLLCFSIIYGLVDGMMAIASILSALQTLTQKQKAQGFGFFELCVSVAYLCGPPIGGKLRRKLVLTSHLKTLNFVCKSGLDFRRVLEPGLRSFRERSVGSFPEQRLVIEPNANHTVNVLALYSFQYDSADS